MSKKIALKFDTETKEPYIDLNDLADLIDISKVEYYDLEEQENGSLILRVYDKDRNLIKPNE